MIDKGLPPMRWYSKKNGDEIENFLQRLCFEVPSVAIDMLKIKSFGEFDNWMENDETSSAKWDIATCGCLVGSAAICAVKDPKVKAMVLESEPPDAEAFDVLFMAWQIALGKRVKFKTVPPIFSYEEPTKEMVLTKTQEKLKNWIEQVGIMVSREASASYHLPDEGYEDGYALEYPGFKAVDIKDYDINHDDRHILLSQYFHDYIRTTLTLMGFDRLPRRIVFSE